jgi:hypothetical protein
MPDAPSTAEDYEKALAAEWGTYVATQEININGVRAFNEGDPVPVSHVTSGIVESGVVAKTTTAAGRAAANVEKG